MYAYREVIILDDLQRLMLSKPLPLVSGQSVEVLVVADYPAPLLEKAGTPIGEHDTMIASHALAANLILVTNNVNHFRQVEGLRWVTWSK